mmetsp:Transcript_6988/g.15113  ORF Transcript_6988/g.15113 Transcript_6988/m.15113 type:complete len:150 (-) Transcript_6988:161-610(-)
MGGVLQGERAQVENKRRRESRKLTRSMGYVTYSPVRLLTRPIHAVGMEANMRTHPMGIRAPNLSQTAPKTNRIQISNKTAQILLVQMSDGCKSRESLISGRSGAMANHMKKAMKKPHQEKWKALMCGRAKEHNLSSFALSSWSGSTATA